MNSTRATPSDLWTIVPVKPFAEAKHRLAPVLSPAKRAGLAHDFFRHVLAVATAFAAGRPVIVISRSKRALELAEANGAIGLKESSEPDLNAALEQAADYAQTRGASKLLIVASDLPLVGVVDLETMAGTSCAIAPDRHRLGTNALLWPAFPRPGLFFGANSFHHHLAVAKAAGLDPRVVSRPGLAHDVDVPGDLLQPSLSPRD